VIDPPATVETWQCPECGRFETHNPFKHFNRGRRCPGTPIRVVYVRKEENEK
jgi:hypothetical protein